MDSPRKDPLLGTQVGEYVVEERIGIGGMGVVYRASQKRIGKTVAIKVLRAEVMEDPREMERFLDEAKAVNAISHRGIISIFGSGELADGRQYLVMEYLKGEGLDAKLKREGRVPAADLIPILEEIAGALQGCHNAGIVHRDLKPGNVFLVDQDDGKPWVKLLDFGLARRGERTDVSRIAGTPDYLSPEHSRGLPAGPPSDLYSLGVMAFQLLTGRLPFNGRTPLEVMEKHVYDDPPHPVLFEPSIPDALNQLVLQLMRKEPAQRPQMLEVKALLKQAAKQSRSASTQPGEVLDPADVLRARASAEALEAASAPTPLPGDSGL
jgi:eukaryotic-like serine/threonine-protein kinase